MSFWGKLSKFFNAFNNQSTENIIEPVQKIIGYDFYDKSLLLLSLTHRSFHHGEENNSSSNERLEYLGDSVLGLVIADRLYRDYPDSREGELTKTKSMLVNETTLATIGKAIKLNQYIRLSPEENRLGGRERSSIIADAFESIIGAVYLDGGFRVAKDVVLRLIYLKKDSILTDESQRNYKGELLELMQARGVGMPHYVVVSEKGPDHEKEFSVEVHVANKKIGSGSGFTKKEAEQKAAAMALESLENNEIGLHS